MFNLPIRITKVNDKELRTAYQLTSENGINICSLSSMKLDGNRHPDTCEYIAYWVNIAFGLKMDDPPNKPRGLKLPLRVEIYGNIYDNKNIVIGSHDFYRSLNEFINNKNKFYQCIIELQFILDCCIHKRIYYGE